MYPFYSPYQIPQQFPIWYNQQYMPQAIIPHQQYFNPQYPSAPSNLVNPHASIINKDPKTISNSELTNLLNHHTNKVKQQNNTNQLHELPILIDAITLLSRVQRTILITCVQDEFFSLLRMPFVGILSRWRRLSSLTDVESSMFGKMTKLIKRLIRAADDIKQLPSWLLDSTLLETIGNCLTDIATSGKFLDEKNKREFKYLIRLTNAYIDYQDRLNDETNSNKDTLVHLIDPILQCLSSNYCIDTFTKIQTDRKSMTSMEKFFLVKCPAFLISYTGSRLEQTMEALLSTMLPRYVISLDKLIPSANNWKRSAIRAILYLLKTINHGASQFQTNAKLVSAHLGLIDDVLKLIDQPIFYNNLQETLSNTETIFINTAIDFLVNMTKEPAILAHIKQCHVAPVFLRLTSCKYEPLVLNVYTLLAYTTHEEDIKAMHNPGRLLLTTVKSLKTTLNQSSYDENHGEQLLETLKGLIQHDQLKDEVMKQNLLPFFLECTNKFTDKALTIIFEILWSLTFREEGALALRSNTTFLDKIQAISKNNKDESLKKAADGLVWKLIREPASLKKVAEEEMETITEVVINDHGEEELVTTAKSSANTPGERIFEYDIMISYCHADKDLIYKLHKFLLAQGFKIWIDLDNMYGPAMNAMADAVENSEFVIMCMSDSYKQSTYCQAEAEYAFNCKRRLLPLLVRAGYKPDGWLGFMIGSRIYIDFGRFDFATACEKLMGEINLQRKRPPPSKIVQINSHQTPIETTSTKEETSVSRREKSLVTLDNKALGIYMRRKVMWNFVSKPLQQWTESDVLDFLSTQRLIPLMPLCDTMDGRVLIQLYKMCLSSSSRAYTLLNNELMGTYKVKLPIGIYTRFLSAMEQRLNTPLPPVQSTQPNFSNTIGTRRSYDSRLPTKPVNNVSYKYDSHLPIKPVNNVSFEYDSHISTTSVNNVSVEYAPPTDKSYDLLITSNAPALQVLRAVERFGSRIQKLNSIRARNSVQF